MDKIFIVFSLAMWILEFTPVAMFLFEPTPVSSDISECQDRIQSLTDRVSVLESELEERNQQNTILEQQTQFTQILQKQEDTLANMQSHLQRQSELIAKHLCVLEEQKAEEWYKENGAPINLQSQFVRHDNKMEYTHVVSSKYVIVNEGKNWTEAKQHCLERSGHLVTIDTTEEWQYLNDNINKCMYELSLQHPVGNQTLLEKQCPDYYTNYWIGVKKNGNQWVWDGSNVIVPDLWYKNEPSGDGGCVEIGADLNFQFNDVPCSNKPYFICEL